MTTLRLVQGTEKPGCVEGPVGFPFPISRLSTRSECLNTCRRAEGTCRAAVGHLGIPSYQMIPEIHIRVTLADLSFFFL